VQIKRNRVKACAGIFAGLMLIAIVAATGSATKADSNTREALKKLALTC